MKLILLVGAALTSLTPAMAAPKPTAKLDALVRQAMADTGAKGIAVAVIENGSVRQIGTWGVRNVAGAPLTADTVMYGASLTKAVFAYTVLELATEGRLDLDTPIAKYLLKPLPEYAVDEKYADWRPLAGDERWRKLTARILLSHSSGFANFGFLEPDGKLRFHFDPGTRYAYSGDGFILLQFVLEKGLGLDVGTEMQRRVFDRFDMKKTSMSWRQDFARNLADGWDEQGKVEPHDERSKVRAAGSMDTTIADFAKFAAALMGNGSAKTMRSEMMRPQLPITTASQFPTLQPELLTEQRLNGLAAGLGLVRFAGPQGVGFFKGGHNDTTGNTWVCLEKGRRCVVILANDVRAEKAFPRIVEAVLGEAGVPWGWEYGTKVQ